MDIAVLKAAYNITDIIGRTVQLKKRGHRYFGICPFHADTNPSLVVYPKKQSFHCFGCLEENELIWTTEGLLPIGKVRVGETKVLDDLGNSRIVLGKSIKETGILYEIGTKAFRHDPLLLTPDHQCIYVKEEDAWKALPYLYMSSERGLRFKGSYRKYNNRNIVIAQGRADRLEIGDFLLFPVIPEDQRVPSRLLAPNAIRPYTSGRRTARITELPVNLDTAWLYGLWVAEGSAPARAVFFSLNIAEDDIASNAKRILEDYFHVPVSYSERPKRNTREVVCSKTDLANQLKYWFGERSYGKRLPYQVLLWPRRLQRALLEGYLDGDGDKRGQSRTVSRELAYGLFALQIQAGLLPTVSYQHDGYTDKQGVHRRPTWANSLKSRAGLNGFFEDIGGQTYYWSRINHLKTIPRNSLVVDISVEGSQIFTTKLGLVHNCNASGDVIDWIQKSVNVDFKAAIKLLGHIPEVEPQPLFKPQPKRPRSISKDAAEYWHSRLGKRRTYFHNRGFTDHTVNHERWGWDGRRFVVTIWEGKPQTSKLLAVKLRRDDVGERQRLAENGLADDQLDKAFHLIPKYVLKGSYDKILYNAWAVEGRDEIWIFFGELDAALATQFGLPSCSPVHGANGWARDWGQSHLRAAKRINIFPDRGEEDQGFRVKAMIGGQARVLSLPEGTWSDFGEFVLAGRYAEELRNEIPL